MVYGIYTYMVPLSEEHILKYLKYIFCLNVHIWYGSLLLSNERLRLKRIVRINQLNKRIKTEEP